MVPQEARWVFATAAVIVRSLAATSKHYFFSICLPTSYRIAESNLTAKSASPR
jgi:hypothetical protein